VRNSVWLPSPTERIAFEACLVSARHCDDAILTANEVQLFRYTEALRVAVGGLAKTLPSHSRLRRTATELFGKVDAVTRKYRRGMAGGPPTPVLDYRELDTPEYRAIGRAIERAEQLRGSYLHQPPSLEG
jgi:hypothetical protein